METELYKNLLHKIKIFENNVINIPMIGEQTKHKLFHIIDDKEKFTLIINKGGRRNPLNLTILLRSNNYNSNMIRFDVNGSDHANHQIMKEYLRHIYTYILKNIIMVVLRSH
ncbi:DUF6978 family protein [Staphylococcus aureus]|uniref:DUF6978 family protein n=1 Tax=Staphylococcus aureus TaxID=1280 RepID=UPI003EB8EFD2